MQVICPCLPPPTNMHCTQISVSLARGCTFTSRTHFTSCSPSSLWLSRAPDLRCSPLQPCREKVERAHIHYRRGQPVLLSGRSCWWRSECAPAGLQRPWGRPRRSSILGPCFLAPSLLPVHTIHSPVRFTPAGASQRCCLICHVCGAASALLQVCMRSWVAQGAQVQGLVLQRPLSCARSHTCSVSWCLVKGNGHFKYLSERDRKAGLAD